MPINFPDSPSVNDEFTSGGRTWKWDGNYWNTVTTEVISPIVDVTSPITNTGTAQQANIGINQSLLNITASQITAGSNGEVIASNGTTSVWTTLATLPAQSSGTTGELLVSNGSSASWSNTITANATNTPALIAKGITSQSAAILRVDSSTINELVTIGNSGTISTKNSGGGINVQINTGTSGNIELGRIDNASSTPFIDFHSGSTPVDYDSRIIASGGNGSIGNGTLQLIAQTITLTGASRPTSPTSTVIPLVVTGAASQSANLQNWSNSAGTPLASVLSDGTFFTSIGIRTGSSDFGTTTRFGISNPTGVTALPTLIVRGIASQTANLQQWQDVNGNVLASISNTGSITAGPASTSETVVRNITVSTSDPTGGTDGDVWLKYTA
jgi:hypothetical protein